MKDKRFNDSLIKLCRLYHHVFVNSEDLLVASSNIESHLETLDRLLTRLNEYGLRVNLTNWKWLKKTSFFRI